MRSRLRLVEFFAGSGLARLGFDGWEVVLANDICPRKAAAYGRNFGKAGLVVGDIARVRTSDIPAADAWWASFPCTDHSGAGLRKGFSAGTKGSAVFQVFKRLEDARRRGTAPSVLAFENVPGFLNAEGGDDFALLLERLARCGYRPGAVIADAAHWLAASRERVFVVAVRKDVAVPACCVSASPVRQWVPEKLEKAVAKLPPSSRAGWTWWDMPVPMGPPQRLADIVGEVQAAGWSGPGAVARFHGTLDTCGRRRLREMQEAGGPAYGTIVEKTDPVSRERVTCLRAEKAFTLVATGTGSSRQRLVRVCGDDIRIREYTEREIARLMGVPDSYLLPDGVAKAMRIMGDGVAVPVVRHLVDHLIGPLAAAARMTSAKGTRIPEDGRRPVKDSTIGVMVPLLPGEHRRVKAAAAEAGIPLATWMFQAASAKMAAAGLAALVPYEPGRRRTG